MPRAGLLTVAIAAMSLLTQPLGARPDGSEPALFDADGYRVARYRTPIHIDPRPASHLALSAALILMPGRDALFVDVMPVESGVRDAASGRWTLTGEHLTIPGAVWHPDTGRTPVDTLLWRALEETIQRARRKRPSLPVIVFCRADCWMSWNAARRLAAGGIENVWWLAEGTDGWSAAGRELVIVQPVSVPERKSRTKGE